MDQGKLYAIEEREDSFTEIVICTQKELDDISLRRIKISFTG